MRLDTGNTRALSLTADSSTTSMKAAVLQGPRGEQGLPGVGSTAWVAAEAVTIGTKRRAPDGSWIQSTSSRTTRGTFDATEATFWVTTGAVAGTLEARDLSATLGDQIDTDGTPAADAVDARIAASGVTLVPRGNRVAFLGDSTVTEGTPPARSRNLSWPTLASMFTGSRLYRAENYAVAGYTSAGVLSTQIPQLVADTVGFGEAHLCVGTNDIATGKGGIAAGITPAATKANIAAIADAVAAVGTRLVLYTIPPRTAAAITAGAATPVADVHAKTQAFNSWLKDFARSRKLQVVDLWAQAVNPSTGEYKTAYSADGIHAAGPGLVYEAERVARECYPNYPLWEPPLSGAFDELVMATQLLPNPLFTVDSNSDGVPDGWSVDGASSSNYAVTLVDGPGMLGNEMRIANIGGPPGGARLLADTITTGFAVGDTIGFGCKVRVTSAQGPQAIVYTVKVTYVGASSNGTLAPINAWQATLPVTGTLWVEDVVPAGTTGIQVEVRSTTTSQGMLAVSQMTLRNLSAALTSGWWTA